MSVASAFICCRSLPLLPPIDEGYVIRPTRSYKGIPYACLVERRGEPNGSLTIPLTLVIMHTNSYATLSNTFFFVSYLLLGDDSCVDVVMGKYFMASCPTFFLSHSVLRAEVGMMNAGVVCECGIMPWT
jgi:hypothetical protein